MYSLEVINSLNERAAKAPKAENNFNRLCSYHQLNSGAVILHSALRRSTGYLNPKNAKRFLVKWFGTNSADERNALVESYFA